MNEAGLKMAFQNIVDLDNPDNDRTFDPETGAYLVYEGAAGREPPFQKFTFHWRDERMELYASDDDIFDENGKKIGIKWTFSRIHIPNHMQEQKDQIAEMIKQAFQAHGFGYDRHRYKVVNAEYIEPTPYEI